MLKSQAYTKGVIDRSLGRNEMSYQILAGALIAKSQL
jgi:hypothetical protein